MVADTTVELPDDQWRGKVPYDKEGHMLNYAGASLDHWREFEAWIDTMELHGYSTSGQPHFVLMSIHSGTMYPILPLLLLPALKKGQVDPGCKIRGWWSYYRSGGSYSVFYVNTAELEGV